MKFLLRIWSFTLYTLAVTGLIGIVNLLGVMFGANKFIFASLPTAPYSNKCQYILLLPGGGIPSPAMLMRAYVAAREYRKNPQSKVVISLVAGPQLEKSTIWDIRNELIFRGVPADSIILETKARNTYEHAKFIKESTIGNFEKDSYLIVTSPTHMPRSVMTFRSAGFKNIYAVTSKAVGDKEFLGEWTYIRYDFWAALSTQVELFRELFAIGFYKVTGRA
ncbi:MAG: YdcF family protein [Nitrospinae bacterium]|nr:YdcF family protein [Nitrospinota bacterium]